MAITYSGAHAKITRLRGKASDYLCECGKQAQEWAYNHSDPCPDEITENSGRKYSADPERYKPMCRSCHGRFDKQHITECPQGHEYTEENTLTHGGKRKCKTCHYARLNQRRRGMIYTPEQRERRLEATRRWRKRNAKEEDAMNWTDLDGRPLALGTKAWLSGGYDDDGRPDYLIHEQIEVVGFGRKRVIVRLTNPEFGGRELKVLPATLVIDKV